MEAALRPYDLGGTQWYVLHQLAKKGPTMQRELLRMLQVERATLSVVVTTLVRKGGCSLLAARRLAANLNCCSVSIP